MMRLRYWCRGGFTRATAGTLERVVVVIFLLRRQVPALDVADAAGEDADGDAVTLAVPEALAEEEAVGLSEDLAASLAMGGPGKT